MVKFCGIVILNLIPKKSIEQFKAKIKRNTEMNSDNVHILDELHSESEYISYHNLQSITLANMTEIK